MEVKFIHQYIKLVGKEYPSFHPVPEFETFQENLLKRKDSKCLFAFQREELTGWLQVNKSNKDHKYWFNMIIQGKHQKQGIGSNLLNMAKEIYDEFRGLVIINNKYKKRDGRIYYSPLEFYKKNGLFLTGNHFTEYGNVELWEIIWLS